MDPVSDQMSELELKNEMLRLLGNELKVARQQLELQNTNGRASSAISTAEGLGMKEENQRLKLEVHGLRLRLEAIADAQDCKSIIPDPSLHDEVFVKLDEALQEKARMEQRHTEELGDLESKLQATRGKCKSLKEIRDNLKESLKVLQSEKDAVVVERDNALSRMAEAKFDPTAFLAARQVNKFQPDVMNHFSKKMHFAISDEARNICTPNSILTSNGDEAIWPGNGAAHCLVVFPAYRYNGKARGSGSWETSHFHDEYTEHVGQQREFFHLHHGAWFYYGIFEYVGMSLITTEDVLKLSSSRVVENIYKRTVIFPELVPPVITKMVKNMYAEGVLRVRCLGLRCVGFNHQLDKAIRTDEQSNNATPHVIPIPGSRFAGSNGSGSKKRGHSSGRGHGQSKKSKKG